jgi:hypothetical protein
LGDPQATLVWLERSSRYRATRKSGTNQLHSSLTEYYNGSRPFEALPYFTAPGTTIASSHYNQPGATIGGPVVIPHLFNGHNRLFFFYAFEGYNQNSSSPSITRGRAGCGVGLGAIPGLDHAVVTFNKCRLVVEPQT